MKSLNRILVVSALILTITSTSCTNASDDDPWSDFEGTYEAYVEKDDRFIQVYITRMGDAYFWDFIGSGPQLITLETDNRFKVKRYEAWGSLSEVEGELHGDTLRTHQEVFEFDDLDNPVLISEREFIRKK